MADTLFLRGKLVDIRVKTAARAQKLGDLPGPILTVVKGHSGCLDYNWVQMAGCLLRDDSQTFASTTGEV